MPYQESNIQAGEFLRLTLASLTRHNLSANPVNYTVWYDAVSGRNAKLRSALDQLVSSGQKITDDQIQALYQRFVTDGDRLLISRLLTKVNLMLREITGYIVETKGDLDDHSENLEGLAQALENLNEFHEVREVVDRMLEETRAIMNSGVKLQTRMKISSEDLKQLQEELSISQKQAMTDALTGLINRRGMAQRMELERIRARQNRSPFAVILLDIDFFKRVNDTFGHLVGDSLLKGVARILKSQTRKNDMVARFGGEEFLTLLPETDEMGALAVAEKIKAILSKKEWKVKDSGRLVGRVTASMGISIYRLNENDTGVIDRADKALYQAKNLGRNRIVVHSHMDAEKLPN